MSTANAEQRRPTGIGCGDFVRQHLPLSTSHHNSTILGLASIAGNATADDPEYRKLSTQVRQIAADNPVNLGPSTFLNDEVFAANATQLKLACCGYGDASRNNAGETNLFRDN
jgi:hypothetical protein